jgi:alpha-L-rhamnosidase
MRIEVRKPEGADDVVITSAIRTINGTFVTVDENRSVGAGWSLKKIGFQESGAHEAAEFDNIIITTGDNTVLYNETFYKIPRPDFGTHGTVNGGVLQVRQDTFHSATNVVDIEYYPLFRKVVSVGEGVRRARLYATARGYYEYSINGEKVGDEFLSPGNTDYFYTIMYQIYDVTSMLKVGANALGAMVGMGWYSGPYLTFGFNLYGSTQSVLGKLVIEYENGTRQVVITDGTWKMHRGPIKSANNYYGEDYDSAYECRGWNTPDYNDSEWKPVDIYTAVNESVDIIHQQGPPVRVVHRFENPVLTEPVPGKYTYDFGQNMAGVVSVKLKGAAGTRVTLRTAEMLNTDVAYQNPGEGSVKGGDGPPGSIFRTNLRGGDIDVVWYTLRGDPEGETYTPRFTFHGFRYVEITGLDAPLPPANVTALVFSSDNEQTSSFETSNPKVNKLYSNVVWSMRSNFVSIPTDCPNRDERLGWTGDAQIFCRTATYLSNCAIFFTKWLRDLRSQQLNHLTSGTITGQVCLVVPAVPTYVNYANFWGDASVIVPWVVYQQFGDVRLLEECFMSMRAWVDFLNAEPRTVNFLRVDNAPSDNNYGDWCSIEDSPKDMTNTLVTAYVNKLLGKVAAVLGAADDAKKYSDISASMMVAFNKKFRNADGTLTANTQSPYAILIYFGLANDDKDRLFLAQMLAKNINDHGGRLTSGFIGVEYLTPSLSQSLQAKTAFTLLEQEEYPSWIYCINQGATTSWENWNSYTHTSGFSGSSLNHYAFSAIGEWMFSGVLGIRLDDNQVGYRQFLLDPQIGGTLTFARGHYDSICGRIESSWTWNHETGAYAYNCTVPANTRATVFVPADAPNQVTEGKEGKSAYNAEGVTYVGYNGDTKREIFELASGSYMFGSNIKAA